mgnify:CR=1 FL=1
MENLAINDVLQFGALGVLTAMLFSFFRFLKEEQAYKREDTKAKEALAAAISKMTECSQQLVVTLKDMQLRCATTQEKCQESTRFLGSMVDDLKHGVRVD